MSQAKQHSTIHSSDIADVAADAVKRAVEARQQAGIELSGEQLNSISGGASFYLKDPFIYGIKIDPYWLGNKVVAPQLDKGVISGKTLGV